MQGWNFSYLSLIPQARLKTTSQKSACPNKSCHACPLFPMERSDDRGLRRSSQIYRDCQNLQGCRTGWFLGKATSMPLPSLITAVTFLIFAIVRQKTAKRTTYYQSLASTSMGEVGSTGEKARSLGGRWLFILGRFLDKNDRFCCDSRFWS